MHIMIIKKNGSERPHIIEVEGISLDQDGYRFWLRDCYTRMSAKDYTIWQSVEMEK